MQNKPNLLLAGNGAKQSQFRQRVKTVKCLEGSNVRNEPNLAGRLRPRRANRAKRTQSAGAVSSPRRADCAKRTQFRQPGRGLGDEGRTCKTKPNPGSTGWHGVPGAWDEGQMRKTKPIPHTQDIPSFHYSIIPPFLPRADHAKQSQTWEDWGMWAKAALVSGLASPESGTCETNPIFRSWYE